MTPDRFCDWLQGFVELTETDSISDKQWLVIKDHLKLVFDKKTPDRSREELEYIAKVITPSSPMPTDFKKFSDLIGKEVNWDPDFKLKPPYTITC